MPVHDELGDPRGGRHVLHGGVGEPRGGEGPGRPVEDGVPAFGAGQEFALDRYTGEYILLR